MFWVLGFLGFYLGLEEQAAHARSYGQALTEDQAGTSPSSQSGLPLSSQHKDRSASY